jgi:hypothetical protein
MINILNKSYISIPVEYKTQVLILYASKYKNVHYININSLCGKDTTVKRWKRRTSTSELIKNLSIKDCVSKPFLSSKNKGTWISSTLFEDFGNWLGEKLNNFGTYVKTHISKLYSKHKTSGPRLRFNSNHFINLTDISNIYEKDIRTWKKTKAYKEYTLENKDHCLSGNNITDELGIRTTYGHPTLAFQLLEYYNKKNDGEDDIQYSLRQTIEKHEKYSEVTEEIIEPQPVLVKSSTLAIASTVDEYKLSGNNLINCQLTLPNGNTMTIPIREDGYINATALCKAGNKLFGHYKENKKTKAYLQALESIIGIPIMELFDVKVGGNHSGTYVHRKVALHLAQWISPEFAVQVSGWVEELQLENKQLRQRLPISINTQLISYKLTLKNGNIFEIPTRTDAYINVTLLCKAAGKRIDNWTRLKRTQELISELSNSLRSEGVEIIHTIEGKHGGTYYHPDLAIQLAQWLSPSFAIQVSRWIRELMLTGKVEMGKEKTSKELDNIFNRKTGLNTLPYEKKDVVYALEFTPNEDVEMDWENAEEEGRKYYKFGTACDISNRLKQHESDKDFKKVRLDRCFVYNCGYDITRGEKKIKRVLDNLDIRIKYGRKTECFVATPEELQFVYNEMEKHNKSCLYTAVENIKGKEGDDKIQIEKMRIDFEERKHDKYIKLFENDKITFEQMEKMLVRLKTQ